METCRHRVAIYIDGPNFGCAANKLGIRFSFRTFLNEIIKQNCSLVIKNLYFDEDQEHESGTSFRDTLEKILGFNVIAVPKKVYHNKLQENNKLPKSRTDPWIICDIMENLLYDDFDVLILFSGDSDFERVLQIAKERGKEIIIVSSRQSLAEELRHFGQMIILEEWLDTTIVFDAPPRPDVKIAAPATMPDENDL